MNDDLGSFPWPPMPGTSETPRWCGDGFECAGTKHSVLRYAAAVSHWNDDLTKFHEDEAGESHPIDVASRELAMETVKRYMGGRETTLLEIGSSSGYLLRELHSAFPEIRLIGSDYIAGPLEQVAARIPSIPLLQFDLRECPLPSNSVDGVILLNVLEHIDDDNTAVRQVSRILKPGGIVHIEVPAGPGCYDIYDEHLMHHRRYKTAALERLLNQNRLEVIKSTHLGVFPYPAFWFVKKRNRRLLSLTPEEKKRIVAAQIRRTTQSKLLGICMRLETWFGRKISYPCGIRCVLIGRKLAG